MIRFVLIATLSVLLLAPAARAGDDMIVKKSPHPVAKTLDRLATVLEKKGITVFARIDHAAGAAKVGQTLRPTELLIFGNPKLGTPLMTADQRIGVALPLKALAWEDGAGNVWLGYTKPDELKDRFDIEGRDEVFKKMAGALDNLTNAALKPE
jgi:uncharacterized protein (DUF302 family)